MVDEGYYESMTDMKSELLGKFDGASEEDLKEATQRIGIGSMCNIPMDSGIG